MTKPVALIYYENLLTGNQVVNRLHDLGYRVALVSDLKSAVAQALAEKPMVVLLHCATQSDAVAEAIHGLKAHPATAHVPILAFTKGGRKAADAARAAGAALVAGEAGIVAQLPDLLDQILWVE